MSIYVTKTGTVATGTANQITANGTGNAINVVGARNFNLIVQTTGIGTAVCRLEGTMDNTNWYPITWGTAKTLTAGNVTTNSLVSNQAHNRVRIRMKVPTGGYSDTVASTYSAWVVIN